MPNLISPLSTLTTVSEFGRRLLPGRRALALLLVLLLSAQALVPPTLASSHASLPVGTTAPPQHASRSAAGDPARPAAYMPAAETFGVVLTPLGTAFNSHAGIDYHQRSRSVVVSANYPTGQPNNFELIEGAGAHLAFSNVGGLAGSLKIATARDDGLGASLGGFRTGELFTGTGLPGQIARVAPDGTAVQNPWVTLQGEAGLPGGLHVDRTGVFGGDLVVVTDAGGVWRINSSGAAARVASLNTPLHGVTTVPADAAKYGPWAGKILVGAKAQAAVIAVDAQGGAVSYALGVNPEDIRLVPAHENFFGLDTAGGKLWGAPADAFTSLIGDILVAQESPGVLMRVRWNGAAFEAGQIAQVPSWGQTTFAPAGVAEVQGVKQLYDKIAVVRHAPVLNSGRVEGALWQLSAENVKLGGSDVITSDLLVPGRPSVNVGNSHPNFGGVIEGVEDSQPTGYTVSIGGNATLLHLITRTNPIKLSSVAAPPAPTGARDVSLTSEGQRPGDFSTLRNLSLSGKAGAVLVPPGTYGNFSLSGRTALVLGVENATEAAVYNLQSLTLTGGSELRLKGPVVLTVRGDVSLTGSTVGAADAPRRMLLRVAEGSVKVGGGGVLYGVMRAPRGAVEIVGQGRVRGTVMCDRLTVSGGGILQVTETDVPPPPVNRPPAVDAGTDQVVTLPADTVRLNGAVSDDGLPQGSTLSVKWSAASGPGPVSFGSAAGAATTATFSVPGVYVLKLTASDGMLTAADTVQVEVVPRNQPPVVNAGPDVTVKLPNPVNLNGTVSDDALPYGSTVTVKWSVMNGPAAVSFDDDSAAPTSATFGAPGTYTLRLSASDTELTAFDELVVTVMPSNQPPTADAGPDQSVSLDETLPAPQEFKLRTISTGFNSPIGIDYHPPTGKVIMSVNYNSGGQPFNFETVAADGTHAPFSNIHGLTDELKLATVRDDTGGGRSIGGFQVGELFTGSGVPGVIVRVSPDGSTVQSPWVTLPGESGLMRGSLYVDRTGIYGGDLIVVTTSGGVWRVNSAGQPTKLAQIPTHLEGLSTIPDVPERYGPWAGKILIGAETERRFYAVDAQGHTKSYDIGISPEDIDIIPAKENFFGVAFGNGALMGAPASAFNGMVGDLLVTQEFGTLFRVRWNGTEFEKTALASVAQWEHVTFAPAGIVEISPVGATVTLNGTVTDDAAPGLPLSVKWEKVSGPGAVTFNSLSQPVTQAVFNQPGTYVLRLTADDTEFAASDEVTVEVTSPIPPLTDATLKLSPEAAGPNVTGTAQKFRATLLDRHGFPIIGALAHFNVVGPNATSGDAPTNFVGVAEFSYTGGANGDDKVSARASDGSLSVESNQAAVNWVTPVQRISTTTVLGRFFTSNGSGAFNAQPTQTPVFSQYFPTINFNPPAGTVPGNTSGVDEWTRPFTNVTTDLNGNFTGTIPAQGNGYVAGIHGPLFDFNAVFTGNFTVAAPGNVTFNFFSDDGFVFGVGGGAVRVGGALSNPPPSGRTPFEDMPVMGAFNNATAPVANSVTVFFPAAGSYPYEVDYSECCNAQLALTMTTAESGNHGVPPTGSLALSPVSPAPREVGQSQTFNVTATDASGNPMAGARLRLNVSGIDTLQLNATADADGRASFTYTGANAGTDSLQVSAPVGATIAYSNVVSMRWNPANQAPVVSAGPDLSVASVNDAATLAGSVNDDGLPAGASITSQWTKLSGPGPVTFANPSAASTAATFSVAGVYVLRLTASDTLLSASDDVTVTVNGTNQPPEVNAGPDQTITLPKTATLGGTATDDGLPAGSTLSVAWSQVSGPGSVNLDNPNGAVTIASFSEAGTYVLRLTASDSALNSSDEVVITVNPAVPPPAVSIASPADGGEVTTRAAVVGSVSAGSNWLLECTLGDGSGAANWMTLASGNTPVEGGLLGVFDPTLLLNGTYSLRLVATDAAGQSAATSISVVVNGGQKVGNFSLSFSDLKVPVARLPFQILRTYDSRDKRSGDFGGGWTLGLRNVRVEKSGILGANWEQTRRGTLIPTYCLEPRKPHVVTVTFPDDKVYRFQTVTSPQCGVLTPIETAAMGFAPLPGTHGTLAAIGENDILVLGDAPGPVELRNFDDLQLYDPTVFQLTTEDGSVFIIDQSFGVRRVTDTNGSTLTVSADGIRHSSGKSVVFTRDAQGRITQITDPAGNAMTYGYDANGDLVSFTDREHNTTTFTYNATHGLLTINNPQGVQPIRNEYDAAGRLLTHTDAFGKVVTYGHDLTNRVETVTDRLGKTARTEYDERGNVVRSVDAGGAATTFTFDGNDNVLTCTDALGRTTSFTYDANGYRASVTDPLGNVTRMTYNNQGRPLTFVDQLGHTTVNSYDGAGNLLSSKDPLGNEKRYTYSPALGLPTSKTDALGNTTSYEYTGTLLMKVVDALGNMTTFAYDANGNRTSTTMRRTAPDDTPETLTTTVEFDRLDRPVKTTYPDGSTDSTLYDQNGKPETVTDQLGRRTAYEYDEAGRLIRTTYPDGTTVQSAYDAEGRLVKSTDQAGRVTSYAYDTAGRPALITYPDGSTAASAYDVVGQVTAVTDALGHSKRYEYDALGRRTKVIDALGRVKTITYDAASNQLSFSNAGSQRTTYEYDANNRRTKTVFSDGTTNLVSYDALGRVAQRTDQAGRAVSYQYDALDRLAQITDALGQETSYGYDEVGNFVSQTDARSHITRFEYNRAGLRTRRTLPLGMSESYAYDQGGRVQTRTDFRGYVTTYAYDLMGRLLSRTPDARLGEPTVRFTYTTTGRRASMTDANGVTTYTYDGRDRLISKAAPQGTLTYAYDLAGNLLSVTSSHAGGLSLAYAYDALDRLTAVTDRQLDAAAASYTYDLAGNLDSTAYANGVKSTYAYDPLNRLTALTAGKASTLASYSYTLNAAGNRLAVAEQSGRTVSYSYDAVYRLTGEAVANAPDAAGNGAVNYTYDEVGNRLARTSTLAGIAAQTFSFDANDRLVGDTYDADGNTTASVAGSYDYDSYDRLTQANGGAVRFTYDGDGNRVAQTVGGVTTHYLLDTNNPTGHAQVAEEIVGGSVRRVYAYGHDLISQRQLLGGGWATSFYGYDGHGSVRFLTDEAGALTDTYDYDAFGNLVASTGATPNDYLYAGEQRDAALGLYYLRARYLNTGTGRFQTADSFEGRTADPQSLHKYLYTNDDPVNNIDPSGHNTFSLREANVTLPLYAMLALSLTPLALPLIRSIPARSPSGTFPEDSVESEPEPGQMPLPDWPLPPAGPLRVDEGEDDQEDNSEIFYRAMSSKEYARLSVPPGQLSIKASGGDGRELFVTKDLNYVVTGFLPKAAYPIIVKFHLNPGTTAALFGRGAADDSIYDNFPLLRFLPRVESGNPNQVHIKFERGAITYGLRRNTIGIFNVNIKRFYKIADDNQLLPGF